MGGGGGRTPAYAYEHQLLSSCAMQLWKKINDIHACFFTCHPGHDIRWPNEKLCCILIKSVNKLLKVSLVCSRVAI